MRICVCGDRNWIDIMAIRRELKRFDPKTTTIVHGGARGADRLGALTAEAMGFSKIEEYPARWDQHGRAAGPIRNREMVKSGLDLVLAFHPNINKSKGTKNMVQQCRRQNIPVEIFAQ